MQFPISLYFAVVLLMHAFWRQKRQEPNISSVRRKVKLHVLANSPSPYQGALNKLSSWYRRIIRVNCKIPQYRLLFCLSIGVIDVIYVTDIVKLAILGSKYRNIASKIANYRDIVGIFGGLILIFYSVHFHWHCCRLFSLMLGANYHFIKVKGQIPASPIALPFIRALHNCWRLIYSDCLELLTLLRKRVNLHKS